SRPTIDRGPRRDDNPPAVDRGPRRDDSRPTIDRGPRRDDNPPAVDRGPRRDDSRPTIDRGPRRDENPPAVDRGNRGQESNGRRQDPISRDRGRSDGAMDRDRFRRGDPDGGSIGRAPAVHTTDRSAPGIAIRDPRPYRDRALDIFTRSNEGRRSERGVYIRPAHRVSSSYLSVYFGRHYAYYPHYCPTYSTVNVVISPYHFYVGVVPSYIYRQHVYVRPPRVVYIEVPIYVDGYYRGYRDSDYYLNRTTWWSDDRSIEAGVRNAVEDLEDAFRYSDITRLTQLADPTTDIAIFTQGRYQYSVRSNDYLDMTRDFMVNSDTVRFDVFNVRRRSNGVYNLSAKHVYRDREGGTSAVYLSFVLERVRGYWTITQVDTAPDRL
ncbi:MAG: hypothetical protein HUU17_11425, partial [Chthonomonadales bacterium]|nr:hypothetical protein [Chthonomonadales bacterium]